MYADMPLKFLRGLHETDVRSVALFRAKNEGSAWMNKDTFSSNRGSTENDIEFHFFSVSERDVDAPFVRAQK